MANLMGALRLNRDMSSDFLYQKSANYVKFTKECVMCIEKHVLVKKYACK